MIASRPYTNLEAVKSIFSALFDNINLKLILANTAILLSWMFNGELQVVRTVFILMVIDIATGVWSVIKLGGWDAFKSREFIVGPIRFGVYITLMYVARCVDSSFPVHWAAPIMDTFIITTEAKSIFENFEKLGYPVPTLIINKLKDIYSKKE